MPSKIRINWVPTVGVKVLISKIRTRTGAGNDSVVIRQALIRYAEELLGAPATAKVLDQYDTVN